jgi:hypothetical protein
MASKFAIGVKTGFDPMWKTTPLGADFRLPALDSRFPRQPAPASEEKSVIGVWQSKINRLMSSTLHPPLTT